MARLVSATYSESEYDDAVAESNRETSSSKGISPVKYQYMREAPNPTPIKKRIIASPPGSQSEARDAIPRAPRSPRKGAQPDSGRAANLVAVMWIVDVLLSVLYPPCCVSCGRALGRPGPPRFCRGCERRLGEIVRPCRRCGEPGEAPCCERCRSRPPPFGRTLAPWAYREGSPIAAAIARWKYGREADVGSALCRLFAERTAREALCYDLVVPVPLHPGKLRARGFNQSAGLARALNRTHSGTGRFAPRLLKRRSQAVTQTRLGRRARDANVRDVFTTRWPVRGLRVLLVDDVLTSGATTSSCARALLRAGADSVDLAVLARTPREGASR